MKTIHKHEVPIGKRVEIEMPVGATVRKVEYLVHERSVFIWAEVTADVTAPKEKRFFKVFCTGDGLPDSANYVGSTIDQYFPEAYHVYEMFVTDE